MRPNVQIKLPIQKSPLFGSELCVNAHMIGTNLFNKGGPLHEKKPFASISTRKCALRCLCIALLPCSSCGWGETWDWVLPVSYTHLYGLTDLFRLWIFRQPSCTSIGNHVIPVLCRYSSLEKQRYEVSFDFRRPAVDCPRLPLPLVPPGDKNPG